MRSYIILLILIIPISIGSQVIPGTPVSGLPKGTSAQLKGLTVPSGFIAFSTDENIFYYYNGTSWLSLSSVPTSAKIFYPPSVAIDASTTGSGRTLNLYSEYINQFGTPAVSSTGAPSSIPTYSSSELYYYVTKADTDIFNIVSITDTGLLTYDILDIPDDDNTILNIVFVVK